MPAGNFALLGLGQLLTLLIDVRFSCPRGSSFAWLLIFSLFCHASFIVLWPGELPGDRNNDEYTLIWDRQQVCD